MSIEYPVGPELEVTEWLNSEPLTLEDLRGRVVMIEAFQMLCPGCVAHGLPLAKRVADAFSSRHIAVIGLHSVFEHHEAQGTRAALAAFVHEYRIDFPIAIDAHSNERLPKTMTAYLMRGTPSLILLDHAGQIRMHEFGAVADLQLGAKIQSLIEERPIVKDVGTTDMELEHGSVCSSEGCDVMHR